MTIRTVIGEAGNQPPVGQAAVAASIFNRVNAGTYGDNPTQVVLAPNQFEPWSTRAKELSTIPRTSKAYQQVGQIVDGVHSGDIPDPTGGATHFLNEATVRQRTGGTLPTWAQGDGVRIGAHTFFQPDGVAAINNAIGTKPPQSTAMGFNQEPVPDHLGALLTQSTTSPSGAQPTAASDSQIPDHIGALLKASQDGQPPAAAASSQKQMIGNREIATGELTLQHTPGDNLPYYQAQPKVSEFQERTLNPLLNLPFGIAQVAGDYGNRLKELSGQNASVVGEGIKDISQNNAATGALKIGLGALGYMYSPLGAIDKPIENMTGNKNAGDVASMVVPGTPLGKLANSARPTVSALTDIVKDIGKENLPQVVQRLESNPKLTLMDVAPTVRGNAAGLATDPANAPAMNALNAFQGTRMAGHGADTTNIFEDALGPTPNMAKTIDAIKQRSADVGKQMIEPALENAAPIPVKSLTGPLDRMIASPEAIAGETPRIPLDPTQTRLMQLRNKITSGETAPLNERVKFAIDPINDAISGGTMSDARTADFTEARRMLNSARRGNTSEEDLISGLNGLAKKQKIVGPIDDAIKMITKGPTEYRSADFVHGLQSRLREEASNLSKSATGSDRNMGSSLHDARDKLVEQIDKAAGGAYRPALKQYAESKAIDEAFKEGFNVFSNPSGAEAMIANHPDMWKKWLAGASDSEKRAVSQGILFGANNKIANTRRGLDVPENSYAHERIASVIGKPNADEIVRRLGDWRDIAATDAALQGGSATALRVAGQKNRNVRMSDPNAGQKWTLPLMAGLEGMQLTGKPLIGGAAVLGMRGVGKGLNYVGKQHDIASNTAYANWASATGQKRDDLLNVLRDMAQRSNPTTKGNKLLNLAPPSILQALPR
jgi:hypothetical protein